MYEVTKYFLLCKELGELCMHSARQARQARQPRGSKDHPSQFLRMLQMLPVLYVGWLLTKLARILYKRRLQGSGLFALSPGCFSIDRQRETGIKKGGVNENWLHWGQAPYSFPKLIYILNVGKCPGKVQVPRSSSARCRIRKASGTSQQLLPC